jgi:uncharacterized RDD family membrane protein YckC
VKKNMTNTPTSANSRKKSKAHSSAILQGAPIEKSAAVLQVNQAPVKYAGFWRRLTAYFVDSIVLSILYIIVILALGFAINIFREFVLGQAPTQEFETSGLVSWLAGIAMFLVPAIIIIMFWKKYGATPGKMLLGCKIVDATTFQKLSYKQCIIRLIGYYLSAIILFIGYITIIFSKRKQGLHDKLANTIVIKRD